ncbi:MAG: glycosyltransferase family 39 protein [Anaerolineales bacterium]|nr:glycosyltransferase family 39 protein [Anaerolineales bacterium]
MKSSRFYLPFSPLNIPFIFALILGLGLRLYDLTDEPLDFHPTRQLRGAIVARGIYYQMLPSADETTRQQAIAFQNSTGQYEPPILESLAAITYLAIGREEIWVARVYNTLFWIIGGVALFALALRMARSALPDDPDVRVMPANVDIIPFGSALLALAYYLALPFGVQASRSFQPDPGMVMWIVLSIYCLYRWSETQAWKWAIATGILAGIAVLVKAVAFYILAGAMGAMIVYTFLYQQSRSESNGAKASANKRNRAVQNIKIVLSSFGKILTSPQVWLMGLLMIVPAALYYLGRGGRASEYFSSWTAALSHLLLQPMTYLRWLNLVQELMGVVFLLLALLGALLVRRRNQALILGLWAGYLVYGLFLPYQMYSHSYYHLQLIPIVALSLAPLFEAILERVFRLSSAWKLLFASLALAWLAYWSWSSLAIFHNQDFRDERAYWQEIASFLPDDGKIVAVTQDYGYPLMYYGWRKVILWPNLGEQQLNKLRGSEKGFEQYFAKRTQGKRYFLVTALRQFDNQVALKEYLLENYHVFAEGPGYLIFDLSQPKNAPARL